MRRVFRFGPLERRGVVGSLRVGQVLVTGIACCLAVVVFRTAPNGAGFVTALGLVAGAAVIGFVPFRGRTAEEWAPVAASWLRLRARRGERWRSERPVEGASATLDLPDALTGCELLSVPVDGGHEVGVFKDPQLGAYTAVLAAKVHSFGLLAEAEQERRLERWGRVLAGLARNRTPVRRVQVLERTVPGDGDELQGHLFDAADLAVPADDPGRRSYEALLDTATQVTQDHEVFIALQVDQRRAWAQAGRDARSRKLDRDAQACGVLIREVQTFAARFDPADVVVTGLLSPSQYASAIRLGFDPYGRRHGVTAADRAFGPIAADTTWSTYRADGALHRTYWIAQWPRLEVRPTFLGALLLGAQAVRSVSIVLEPVAPHRARAAVEAAITSDEADEQLRAERGFRTPARKRKQQEATRARESELAEGHEEVRFAGYVTVSGRDAEDLDRACEEIEQAAQQAHLDLEPLWGEQDTGFPQGALPVARGLRSATPIGRGS
ncbi:MAG TPA: SCO6880 family protein [Solirubrobacteraceae bacterium]|jgi:hypothetical protein